MHRKYCQVIYDNVLQCGLLDWKLRVKTSNILINYDNNFGTLFAIEVVFSSLFAIDEKCYIQWIEKNQNEKIKMKKIKMKEKQSSKIPMKKNLHFTALIEKKEAKSNVDWTASARKI